MRLPKQLKEEDSTEVAREAWKPVAGREGAGIEFWEEGTENSEVLGPECGYSVPSGQSDQGQRVGTMGPSVSLHLRGTDGKEVSSSSQLRSS